MSKHIRLALLLAVVLASLAAPAAVSADDGEILAKGTNIAGEVYLNNGRPRINFNNVGNCPGTPPPGAVCGVQVRFAWQCDGFCFWDEVSPFYNVPVGQDYYQASICVTGRNRWHADTRLRWIYPTTHTIEFWGQGEFDAAASGGVYRTIAKFMFDVSLGVGLRLGTKLKTITASSAYSPIETIGSSFGFLQGPSTC